MIGYDFSAVKNGSLVSKVLQFAVRGRLTQMYIGGVRYGKTSLLTGAAGCIDKGLLVNRGIARDVNRDDLRDLEKQYSEHKIICLGFAQEKDEYTEEQLKDTVELVDKLSTDSDTYDLFAALRNGRAFAIFNLTAFSVENAISVLRHSIVNVDRGNASFPVERYVNLAVRLGADGSNRRVISGIDEIIPCERKQAYQSGFTVNPILKLDIKNNVYVPAGRFSGSLSESMLSYMDEAVAAEFKQFQELPLGKPKKRQVNGKDKINFSYFD